MNTVRYGVFSLPLQCNEFSSATMHCNELSMF